MKNDYQVEMNRDVYEKLKDIKLDHFCEFIIGEIVSYGAVHKIDIVDLHERIQLDLNCLLTLFRDRHQRGEIINFEKCLADYYEARNQSITDKSEKFFYP